MNNKRRREINRIVEGLQWLKDMGGLPGRESLDEFKSRIEDIYDEEQDSFYNMPESLQYSTRGEASEEAQENLEEAVSTLEDIIDEMESDPDFDEYELESWLDDVVGYLNDAAM